MAGSNKVIHLYSQFRKHNGTMFPVIEVLVDEVTVNTTENIILKLALDQICALKTSLAPVWDHIEEDLIFIEEKLKAVSTQSASTLGDIEYGPSNIHYKKSVELAQLILRFSSQSEYLSGEYTVPQFMISMPHLFERFVAELLEQEFPNWDLTRKPRVSVHSGRTVHPDIVLSGKDKRVIVECKYKKNMGNTQDFFQLFTYVSVCKANVGFLVYASTSGVNSVQDISVTSVGTKMQQFD